MRRQSLRQITAADTQQNIWGTIFGPQALTAEPAAGPGVGVSLPVAMQIAVFRQKRQLMTLVAGVAAGLSSGAEQLPRTAVFRDLAMRIGIVQRLS